MFSNKEIKIFLIKLGKKLLFPDFSNKLTWYVVTLGSGIIITPQPFKLLIINWFIHFFNINSGVELTLEDLGEKTDYIWGILLIIVALIHNFSYKYINMNTQNIENIQKIKSFKSDSQLLKKFISSLPSTGSVSFLNTHDFQKSFRHDDLTELTNFLKIWKGAEYRFSDKKINLSLNIFISECNELMSSIDLKLQPQGLNGRVTLQNNTNHEEVDSISASAKSIFISHQYFIKKANETLK